MRSEHTGAISSRGIYHGSEVLLAAPRLSSAMGGTQPFDWVVCGCPGTGHLVLCGALWWPERDLHARWGSKVGEERAWYLRSIVLGLRGPEF